MISAYTKTYVIRALHNLENPDISDSENEKLYGMCYRLHGHHYKIQITLEGELDEKTGLCKFREQLDSLVDRELVKRFDGKCLNDTYTNTSGEALTHLFFEILRPHIPSDVRLKLAIQETRKNLFERV
jgi:6-pyruvoyltetrahydropterin/6-carboxytetrahydropterin synthase